MFKFRIFTVQISQKIRILKKINKIEGTENKRKEKTENRQKKLYLGPSGTGTHAGCNVSRNGRQSGFLRPDGQGRDSYAPPVSGAESCSARVDVMLGRPVNGR
jgi:hypothetical protein